MTGTQKKRRLPQPEKKQLRVDKTHSRKTVSGGGVPVCQNCEPKPVRPTKKKPAHKLGSWRGAFAGTEDF